MDGDIDEPVLKSLVDNMKQDVKVSEEVPPDRIVDLAPLREVQQELKIKRTK
jgi:hypothetical protein